MITATQRQTTSPSGTPSTYAPVDHTDVIISVEFTDGRKQRGQLTAYEPEHKRLVLRNADHSIVASFREIRIVKFSTDLTALLKPVVGETILAFRVKFTDGHVRTGRYRTLVKDAVGLHFACVATDGGTYRVLIPHDNILRYQAGDKPNDTPLSIEPGTPPNSAPLPIEPATTPAAIELGEARAEITILRADDLRRLLVARDPYSTLSVPEAPIPTPVPTRESPRELARRFDVPLVDPRHFEIDPQVLAALPESFICERRVLPLAFHDDHLVVAMENPADSELTRMAQFLSGKNVETCVASSADLELAIIRHFGATEANNALLELESAANAPEFRSESHEDLEKLGQEKPIVRLVHSILVDAVRRRASDIHIRPGEQDVELLYREDGTLVQARRFNKALLPAVVARIKIIGRMNVAERRLPQDGRARIEEGAAFVDFRISIIPTISGESVVIRLLNAQKALASISDLGFTAEDQARFIDLLHRSYGILLVTGPTGSGKSMTLYAAMQEVRKQNVNIITVEDPVEYHMTGVEQVQVNTVPGFTFARALRNILRHDPDVIMIGEIRDQETAKIAVESALTGHLVLSTLHTNDAPTAITRLIEMGVESFLVRSSVLGALAQRLVRLNCPHCLEPEPSDPMQRKFLGVSTDEVFYHGRGCDECNDTGFKGRRAVYELLIMTPTLRDMISDDTPADHIRRAALTAGMQPLTGNALALARERRISLAEVYRVRLE
ncbi:MAG: GspE/PulE family protein [Thiotrichales bacterium]